MARYPALAPIGYINDVRTKTVVQDRRKAPIICEAFELYAKNEPGWQIGRLFGYPQYHNQTRQSSPSDKNLVYLSNLFCWAVSDMEGRLCKGKQRASYRKSHSFDRVQEILKDSANLSANPRTNRKPFVDPNVVLCSSGTTAEAQKGHTYHRCAQEAWNCQGEPYVREGVT